MRYKDTRSNQIGGAVYAEDAYNWHTQHNVTMVGSQDPCVWLQNLDTTSPVQVAYVYDVGSGNDWKLTIVGIPAGGTVLAPSHRDFILAGSELGSFSTPNLTATVTKASYEVVRLWLSADNIVTLTNATLVNCDDRKTSTTVMPVKKGENSFLVLTSNTSLTVALTTADALGEGSVFETTEAAISKITRLY